MSCLPVILNLVTVLAHLTVVKGYSCVFKKRPSPSRGGELRWSLPRSELCYCQHVATPQSWSVCPGNDDNKEGDLWFVDDLRLLYQLTLRNNWQKEILDDLLQRTEYCADECTTKTHNCDNNAVCYDISGGFTCACKTGYEGDGVECTGIKQPCFLDINECTRNTDNCHDSAACINSVGSFTCACNNGYSGDGVSCEDINECTSNTSNCHDNAECSNIIGSFNCTCNDGYSGNGLSCEDINECTSNTSNCHDNAECSNSIGSFNCTCNDGYIGDGVLCEEILQVCYDYMGVANGDIPDANMKAKPTRLSFANTFVAYNGRLNANTCWMAKLDAFQPWIQADIGYQTFVSGVVTQGGLEYIETVEWVASFKVSTFVSSERESTEVFVMNGTQVMIFPGNVDSTSLKTSYFPESVFAQIVRIRCLKAGEDYYVMRFEILGCKSI